MGVGSSLLGGILGNREEAKRRKQALKFARDLMYRQEKDFASALQQVQMAKGQYENDPRRAALKGEWDKRLAGPDLITPEMLSQMKNQTYDQAAREGGDAVSSMRESIQRQGLSGSGMAAGMEAATRARSFGRHAGISTQMDVEAATKNRAARDETLAGYQNFAMGDLSRLLGFNEDIASLYGSKRYGNSLLGGM